MVLSLLDFVFALLIGGLTGIVLQRGRACTNTAFRNMLLIRNSDIFLGIVITVVVELIGYQILSFLVIPGFVFQSNPIEFSLILVPFGAFIFGLGTVFAGGCAGGTCYRIGEGSIKSLSAFLGFAFGIGLLVIGPIADFTEEIRFNSSWYVNGQVPSLEILFPRWIWTIFAIVILTVVVLIYRRKNGKLAHLLPSWPPIVTGVLLGMLGISARFFSTISGRPFGFSTTDGIGDIFLTIISLNPLQIGWAGLFIIGLIGGSFISSLQIKEFAIKIPNKKEFLRFFGGGILLGLGAMLALGCNFGHILGGIPELGVSSLAAFFFMVLGNWSASYFYYNNLKRELPKSSQIYFNQ